MHQGEKVKYSQLHVDPNCKDVIWWGIKVLSGVIVGEGNPNWKRVGQVGIIFGCAGGEVECVLATPS